MVAGYYLLKDEWKATRQAAGLTLRLDPPDNHPKRLVAELHVLINGLGSLPPGAAGAFVCLELGDHIARSQFVSAVPESGTERRVPPDGGVFSSSSMNAAAAPLPSSTSSRNL